jgi:hypothetical protein
VVTKASRNRSGTWDQALRVMRSLAKTLIHRGTQRDSKER